MNGATAAVYSGSSSAAYCCRVADFSSLEASGLYTSSPTEQTILASVDASFGLGNVRTQSLYRNMGRSFCHARAPLPGAMTIACSAYSSINVLRHCTRTQSSPTMHIVAVIALQYVNTHLPAPITRTRAGLSLLAEDTQSRVIAN